MEAVKVMFNKAKNQFELSDDYSLNFVSTDLKCEEHTHKYIELVYCFSGTALHCVDGTSYLLRKGDMLLIDKNSTHAIVPKPHSTYCDIMLKPSFFDKQINENSGISTLFELDEFSRFRLKIHRKKLIHFSVEDRKKVEFLIKATEDELKHRKIADSTMKRSALCMLLTLFFRYMTTEDALSVNSELLDYIKDNCDAHLSAGMIADRCSYSVEHFSRKFKKLAGKNFVQYLCECRLSKAEHLLLNTHKTVDVIMVESGFTSRGEFFKKFGARYGQTPISFRKNQKSVRT